MADEETVLEEAMDNLKEGGQRIRAAQTLIHSEGMEEGEPIAVASYDRCILLLEATKWKRLPSRSIRIVRRQGTVVRGTNQG